MTLKRNHIQSPERMPVYISAAIKTMNFCLKDWDPIIPGIIKNIEKSQAPLEKPTVSYS